MADDSRAVIARRTAQQPAKTEEIERLTAAAGYDVVETLSQARPPDGAYNLGEGKAEAAAQAVARTDATLLIVDNDLTPTQTWNLAQLCPDNTRVLDRYRLVLDIFAEGTGDKAAELQVELATLEYDLPRVRNAVGQRDHGLSKSSEKGTPIQDLEARIEHLQRELRELEQAHADRRQQRREDGFDLVALAGYTNAGKSTLLHRLADDLSLTAVGEGHDDLTETAAVEDRLFRTLETTTRRATVGGRQVLLTDTVGLLDELPHDLVESFETTISAATEADLTLVVADVAEEPSDLQRKLQTSLDVLSDARRLLMVLNKADLLSDEEVSKRRDLVAEMADAPVVTASALDDSLTTLQEELTDQLPPTEPLEFTLPQAGSTQEFLSWLHEHAIVENVEYRTETVEIRACARPEVVDQARARAPTSG